MIRLALRLAAKATLTSGGAAPFATMAGPHVFDSRSDPIEDIVKGQRVPIIVLRTDEDRYTWRQGAHRVLLHIQASVLTARIETDDDGEPMLGSNGRPRLEVGWPTTDAGLEAFLDLFEYQITNAFFGSNTWTDWWKSLPFNAETNEIKSEPLFTAPEEGRVRLAVREITMPFNVRLEQLPPPLRQGDNPVVSPMLPKQLRTIFDYISAHGAGHLKASAAEIRANLEAQILPASTVYPALLRVHFSLPPAVSPPYGKDMRYAAEGDSLSPPLGSEPGDLPSLPPPPPDSRLPWIARKTAAIDQEIETPFPPFTDPFGRGYLNYAMAVLSRGVDITAANSNLLNFDIFTFGTDDGVNPRVVNIFLSWLFRTYALFNNESSNMFHPGMITPEVETYLLEQMWLYAKHWSRISEAQAMQTWLITGSENMWMQRIPFLFLSAQAFKNRVDFQARTYDDGGTPAAHYAAWLPFVSNLLDERCKRGLMVEIHSPTYSKYSYASLFNLFDFSEDQAIRTKAEILLDLIHLDWAETQKNFVHGGAKSRTYTFIDAASRGRTDEMSLAGNELTMATSLYSPPDLAGAIAVAANAGLQAINQNAPAISSGYTRTCRRPGIGPPGFFAEWPTGQGAAYIDPAQSVIDYAYVSTNFIMSAARLDPNKRSANDSAQNRWSGMIYNNDNDARIFPQVGLPAGDGLTAFLDNFLCVQNKNVMLLQRKDDDNRSGPRLALYGTYVYFASVLDRIDEDPDGHWIFVKTGSTFTAIAILQGTYAWLTDQKNAWNPGDLKSYIKLTVPKSPMIFVANEDSDYAGDFDLFKTRVKSAPLAIAADSITFGGATLFLSVPNIRGIYSICTTPGVISDGVAIDFAPDRVLDSPFLRSSFGTGVIRARFGDDCILFDVSNPNNPQKQVGPISSMPNQNLFPPGVASETPIVFPEVL